MKGANPDNVQEQSTLQHRAYFACRVENAIWPDGMTTVERWWCGIGF
jgi:hypothetical protein